MTRILFVCTHNRCRSILCESIARGRSKGSLITASAGSDGGGRIYPLTLDMLIAAGYPIEGLVSQSWHDLESFNPNLVITVCDSAAAEVCPVWMGSCEKRHWSLPDPSKLEGDSVRQLAAFQDVMTTIEARVDALFEELGA